MKKLRKNASLATVAAHARAKADKADRAYIRARERYQAVGLAGPEQQLAGALMRDAFSVWSDLNEIAEQLERLASL